LLGKPFSDCQACAKNRDAASELAVARKLQAAKTKSGEYLTINSLEQTPR